MEAQFKRFMVETGRPGLLRREGCVGVIPGQNRWNDRPERLIISRWESLEALQRFAGENWQQGHINPAVAHLIEQVFCDNFEDLDQVRDHVAGRGRSPREY
jgi:hypothetical protein